MRDLLGDGVDGVRQVVDIFARHAGHRDAAVLGQVNAELFGDAFDLRLRQAGEAEHADLVGDVVPRLRRALLLQVGLQCGAHADDAIGHAFDLLQPAGAQVCVAQNFAHNVSAVDGRIRVHRTNQDLQLGHATVGLVFVGARQREGAHALAVEAHVLGVALGQAELVALLGEQSHGEGVLVDVAAGKTFEASANGH